jgi:hypothetical protein
MTAHATENEVVVRQLEALSESRRRTLALVAGIKTEDLVRVHSPLMSPLVWDLGHIAAFDRGVRGPLARTPFRAPAHGQRGSRHRLRRI